MNVLLKKFRDAVFSVIPITIIVLILNFTIVPLGTTPLIKFLIGAVLIIFGLLDVYKRQPVCSGLKCH